MDAGRNSEVELEAAVNHLRVLIVAGAEKITVLNSNVWRLESRINAAKSELRTTKASIVDFMNQVLNEQPDGNGDHGAEGKLPTLRKTLKKLIQLMTLVHIVYKKRQDLINSLNHKHQRLQKKRDVFPKQSPVVSALSLLPGEVWKLILNHVDNANDLRSCSSMCTTFRDLLLPSKTLWMFELVLPHLVKYVKKKDVLQCRQVAKSWREAVDSLPPPKFPSNSNAISVTTHIKSWSQLDRFNQAMNSHKVASKNPFVGKALALDEEDFHKVPLGTIVRELLSWSGVHLQTFTYSSEGLLFDSEAYDIATNHLVLHFLSLRECLQQLPNLRHLKLDGYLDEYGDNWPEIFNNRLSFPQLPYLNSIKLDRTTSVGDWLVLFPTYAHQLVKLEMQDTCELSDWFFEQAQPLQFHSLKELRMHSRDANDGLFTWIRAPQLEIFFVDIWCWNDPDNHSLPELAFRFIRKFPVLRELFVLYNGNLVFGDVVNLSESMYAPKSLETLGVADYRNSSFSLLLRFPYLQHLHIFQKYADRKDEKKFKKYMKTQAEVVEVHKYRWDMYKGGNDLYNSNIWTLLPFLKTITCWTCYNEHKFVYTRGAFEHYKKTRKEK